MLRKGCTVTKRPSTSARPSPFPTKHLEFGVQAELPALSVCRLEAPQDLLRRLKEHEADPALANFACPICWEPFWQPVRTVCGHAFCKGCLLKTVLGQLEQSQPDVSCPVCRHALYVEDVADDEALSTRIKLVLGERCREEHEAAVQAKRCSERPGTRGSSERPGTSGGLGPAPASRGGLRSRGFAPGSMTLPGGSRPGTAGVPGMAPDPTDSRPGTAGGLGQTSEQSSLFIGPLTSGGPAGGHAGDSLMVAGSRPGTSSGPPRSALPCEMVAVGSRPGTAGCPLGPLVPQGSRPGASSWNDREIPYPTRAAGFVGGPRPTTDAEASRRLGTRGSTRAAPSVENPLDLDMDRVEPEASLANSRGASWAGPSLVAAGATRAVPGRGAGPKAAAPASRQARHPLPRAAAFVRGWQRAESRGSADINVESGQSQAGVGRHRRGGRERIPEQHEMVGAGPRKQLPPWGTARAPQTPGKRAAEDSSLLQNCGMGDVRDAWFEGETHVP